MILADTCVWIDHIRKENQSFSHALSNGSILAHEYVIGELSTGNLSNRAEQLGTYLLMQRATTASFDEVFQMIEQHRLWGKGLGWTDAHLLASARLDAVALWTFDHALIAAARVMGITLLR